MLISIFAAKLILFFSITNVIPQKTLQNLHNSDILCTFVHDKEPLKQAGGSASGVH